MEELHFTDCWQIHIDNNLPAMKNISDRDANNWGWLASGYRGRELAGSKMLTTEIGWFRDANNGGWLALEHQQLRLVDTQNISN